MQPKSTAALSLRRGHSPIRCNGGGGSDFPKRAHCARASFEAEPMPCMTRRIFAPFPRRDGVTGRSPPRTPVVWLAPEDIALSGDRHPGRQEKCLPQHPTRRPFTGFESASAASPPPRSESSCEQSHAFRASPGSSWPVRPRSPNPHEERRDSSSPPCRT